MGKFPISRRAFIASAVAVGGGLAVSFSPTRPAGDPGEVYNWITVAPDNTVTEWTCIGQSLPRLDIPSKTDGTARYGIDVILPGMKFAAVA